MLIYSQEEDVNLFSLSKEDVNLFNLFSLSKEDVSKVIIENIILEDGIEIKQNLTDHYTKFEPCFYRNYGKEMVLYLVS
jgi:hypothetical protein